MKSATTLLLFSVLGLLVLGIVTLVSASMGAFFAQFYHDAFLGLAHEAAPVVDLALAPGSASLRFQWRF